MLIHKMIRLTKIICLTLFLSACFNTKNTEQKKEQTSSAITEVKANKTPKNEKYFSNIEDFKRFILGKKWVDIKNENPCDPHGQHITIKDGFIDEYNTIEPSKYTVDIITQIDSQTLGIKIKSKSNRDVVFKVKVIDKEKQFVKWVYNYNEYDAKPYDVICKDWNVESKEKEPYYTNLYDVKKSNLTIDNKWSGAYYFKGGKLDLDYILYFKDDIKLTTQARQYGYTDQLKAIQLGDTLGLFHHKNISGMNYNDTRSYDFLKFYKSSDGKFYFEGKLPYLPEGAIEFEKVK